MFLGGLTLLPVYPPVLVPLGFLLSFGFLLSLEFLLFLGFPFLSEFEGKCSSQVSKKLSTSLHFESSFIPLRSYSCIYLFDIFSRTTCSNRSVSVVFVAFELTKGKKILMFLAFLIHLLISILFGFEVFLKYLI